VHAATTPGHVRLRPPVRPSRDLADEGAAGPFARVKPLGDSDAGMPRPVGISVTDARHHLHVIGATGSGKSTLMINMILADIAAGRGVAVTDPKGDMIIDLLARIPAEAAGRVVLLDPDDSGPAPSLNVLDGPVPELAAEHLVSIFHTIFADAWGPRTDDIFRAAVLTLLTIPPPRSGGLTGTAPTLADVPRLLTDEKLRNGYAAALGGL
jgi:type IV secretory pathway TraG/TraD family ATPase VirD4